MATEAPQTLTRPATTAWTRGLMSRKPISPPRPRRAGWTAPSERRTRRIRLGRPLEIPPELVAQMAEGALARRSPVKPTRARRGSDGAVEAILTLLATVLFGVGWAALELEAGDPALRDAIWTGYDASVTRVDPDRREAAQVRAAGDATWSTGESQRPATRAQSGRATANALGRSSR